jgi:hypothetical protein
MELTWAYDFLYLLDLSNLIFGSKTAEHKGRNENEISHSAMLLFQGDISGTQYHWGFVAKCASLA